MQNQCSTTTTRIMGGENSFYHHHLQYDAGLQPTLPLLIWDTWLELRCPGCHLGRATALPVCWDLIILHKSQVASTNRPASHYEKSWPHVTLPLCWADHSLDRQFSRNEPAATTLCTLGLPLGSSQQAQVSAGWLKPEMLHSCICLWAGQTFQVAPKKGEQHAAHLSSSNKVGKGQNLPSTSDCLREYFRGFHRTTAEHLARGFMNADSTRNNATSNPVPGKNFPLKWPSTGDRNWIAGIGLGAGPSMSHFPPLLKSFGFQSMPRPLQK